MCRQLSPEETAYSVFVCFRIWVMAVGLLSAWRCGYEPCLRTLVFAVAAAAFWIVTSMYSEDIREMFKQIYR